MAKKPISQDVFVKELFHTPNVLSNGFQSFDLNLVSCNNINSHSKVTRQGLIKCFLLETFKPLIFHDVTLIASWEGTSPSQLVIEQ